MPSSPTPTHNLVSAFLFLRTASTAVANLTAQIDATETHMRHHHRSQAQTGYDNAAVAREEEDEARLETEKRDLETWEARLVHAGMGVVEWVAMVRTGRGLPGEILGLIGGELRRKEEKGLVLPEIW